MRQSIGWLAFFGAALGLTDAWTSNLVHSQTPYVTGWRPVPTGESLTNRYNSFSNPGGAFTPTEVRPANELRDSTQQLTRPVSPPGVWPPSGSPPGGSPPGHGQEFRSINQVGQGTASYNTLQQPMPTQPQMAGGTPYSIPVVAGDPRIVSPPPRPTSNYATSPYRLTAYQAGPYPAGANVANQIPQLPIQGAAPIQPPVQPPLTQATQGVVPNSPGLAPQYQQPALYATGYQNCSPVPYAAPGAVAPPTLPPNFAPQMYTPDNAGYKPLFSLGQENYNVLLGRGVIGQPTVYVPGQPVRNFLRYLSP